MSRTAEITLQFGDTERTFRLGIKELLKLQERCADRIIGERGPFRILRDIEAGNGRVEDIRQPILLGLQGAGMRAEDAAKLVKEWVEDRPWHENTIIAMLIIRQALAGPLDDTINETGQDPPPGEKIAGSRGSASPASTATEPSSVSPPPKSVN
jgi:hypothetical protein